MPNQDNANQVETEGRVSLIQSVKSPLGFFTLGVLVVEAIMGLLIPNTEGSTQILLIVAMAAVLVLLFFLVAYLMLYKPRELWGVTNSSSPLPSSLLHRYQSELRLADMLAGKWKFYMSPNEQSEGSPMSGNGVCNIGRSDFRIYLDAAWKNEHGNTTNGWNATDVMLNDCQLTYIFKIPVSPGVSNIGVMSLDLSPCDDAEKVTHMSGSWGMLNTAEYGTVLFERITGLQAA